MESNWAVENLQTIRTLMERSALYRRALAPIMTAAGTIGVSAALVGQFILHITSPREFELYWITVSVVAVGVVYILARRQALKESEAFWSPPTRRVTQALLPPFTAAFIISLVIYIFYIADTKMSFPENFRQVAALFWLPTAWVILYGCGLNAAGFFIQRGIRLFSWGFILGGCAVSIVGPNGIYGHILMGMFFGVLQLVYGIYLYFTETRTNAA